MRNVVADKLGQGRVKDGAMRSDASYGLTGAFLVMGPKGEQLSIISSGVDHEFGWEHVSVSTRRRTPNWAEMCFVKDLFWNNDECVIQFHPPRADYVNYHPFVLHLWRSIDKPFPMPPAILVGPKAETLG